MVRLSYRDDIAPLLTLGLPLVGSAVASFLIHMTDTIMLGWYDVSALAASVLANSLWFLIFIMGAGFGFAVMPIVAAASASGDDTRARRTTRMAFWLSLIFFAVSFPLNWWSGAVFGLMGQEPALAEAGQGYLRITAWAMAPALLMAVLRSYLSALKLTTILLVVTLVGVVLNAIINYALIFGNWGFPEMGLTGAALATVIGNLVALLVLAIYAQIKRPDYNLYQRLWKPDWEAFHQVRRIGLPIGLTQLAESALFSASTIMVGWIGEIELAAHGIALQLTALTFMFHVGMSQSATIRAGEAFGRKSEVELRRVGFAAIYVGVAFGVVVISMFLIWPGFFVGLFIDPAEPQRATLLEVGIVLLMLSTLFQFVDSGQIIANALLRGVQDTRIPMWIATFSYWIVGVPAGYVLAFVVGLQEKGIWLGLTVGLATATGLLMWRFWSRSVRISSAA